MVIWGTRPEAVKLRTVVQSLQSRAQVQSWHTGQHTMLVELTCDSPNLRAFAKEAQSLHCAPSPDPLLFAERVKWRVARQLRALPEKPDAVIVQGDTSSAYGAALGTHLAQLPVFHVESGVRSHVLSDPWPEERFRMAIDGIACLHFAATADNRNNLLQESVRSDQIHVTGNPGLDGIWEQVVQTAPRPRVLITLHRRESHEILPALAQALNRVAMEFPQLTFLWPVHPNPAVREATANCQHLGTHEPLGCEDFRRTLANSLLVLTDSGGVQEEAATLGIPCLVARQHTDRPESVAAGLAAVVGNDPEQVSQALRRELDVPTLPRQPSTIYGDGNAGARIAEILLGRGQAAA